VARIHREPHRLFGLVLLTLLILLVALLAPWISPQNPYDLAAADDVMDSRLPPGALSGDGKLTFWLGTDDQGRDMLSAILYGLRISLMVGCWSARRSRWHLGTVAGPDRGLVRRAVDTLIMRLVDLQLSFPADPDRADPPGAAGQGRGQDHHRAGAWCNGPTTRAPCPLAALVERRANTSRPRAASPAAPRIMFRHLLPNCLPPLIVVATMQVARAITLEATLSFLGLGLPVTEPSLGLLIANGYAVHAVGQVLDQLLSRRRAAGR
jgi:peptide/nickel transport system permease protein